MSEFNVLDFGAVGDGKTLCTAAIQKALDKAGETGGRVIVPPGTYLSGTIQLRSRVTLDLQSGATLLGSGNLADYPSMNVREGDRHAHHLVWADGCHDVMICGGGKIDGNGPLFWEAQKHPRSWIVAKDPRVSPMLEFRKCRDLRIQDVVISNSPGWTCHLHCCDFVWISGVKLLGNIFGPNTDGFDINGCRDVMIANCYIECGDDAICLKTSKDARSCERVTAANCVIRTHCVGFKCGSESFHDFRQIAFSNSVVFRSTRAFGLYCFDGGTIEDVVVSNIVCDTDSGFILNRPIHLDLRKRDVETTLVPMDQQKIGRIRNVQVSNFVARTDGRLLMTAADGGVLENVLLRDIRMSIPAYDDPDPVARGAKSAQFSNHSPDARPARAIVVAENMKNFVLDGLQIDWPDGQDDPNWGGAKMENGSDRVIEPSHARPDFHVVWGKNLRGGMLNVPLAQTNREGVKKFVLIDSDIRHE